MSLIKAFSSSSKFKTASRVSVTSLYIDPTGEKVMYTPASTYVPCGLTVIFMSSIVPGKCEKLVRGLSIYSSNDEADERLIHINNKVK